jgi:hypothetical protein
MKKLRPRRNEDLPTVTQIDVLWVGIFSLEQRILVAAVAGKILEC